ncbi:MAG: ATP-dependent metallopeptidase FtsH/Yme1/Tma family protein [Alphaproteobacteria bacterium]|nr:ATP-dependent metallopeptidase FtsH/Yme1/Tma family protein [Alphaproteobacteria bacterium]
MNKSTRTSFFVFAVVLLMVAAFVVISPRQERATDVGYSDFVEDVKASRVKEVVVKGQAVRYTTVTDGRRETTSPTEQAPMLALLDEYEVPRKFEEAGDEDLVWNLLFGVLPLVVVVLLFFWFMRNLQGTNGRAMNFGKSRAKLQTEGSRRFTFEDVAGIDEVKDELEEIIDFLKDPRKFTRLGGRIPKGVLLMGPPGTGKTLLARAVAGEAGVPFFSISGSDFVEMFVGVGASRVRDLFEQGKKQAPCIIFIDEIDAVGRQRGAGMGGGHDEREQTLNQLLVEMDGFEGTEGVIIIAATNRPDVLDPALLRPGRFDRRIVVPNPDVKGRQRILEIHTRRIPMGDDVQLGVIAKGTPGFSGADLENLCNEAALLAARMDKKQVDMGDLLEAREKIVMGPERRSLVMPDEERRSTAYHEAGHALIAHLLPGHDPVQKITIVPRGRALGVTWTLPSEDRLSMTRQGMYKQLSMMMGGRAAEEVALHEITGGASNDLLKATRIARHMVCNLGMSDELGPVNWGDDDGEPFLGRTFARSPHYSEATARRIDEEVKKILDQAYAAARTILTHNLHVLHRVAQSLIERESLDHEEFSALVDEAGPVVPADDLGWMGV